MEKVATKQNFSLFHLDLWPTTLTYNPRLVNVKVDPHAKKSRSKVKRFKQDSAHRITDGHTHKPTHRCYQTYYLPCYAVDNNEMFVQNCRLYLPHRYLADPLGWRFSNFKCFSILWLLSSMDFYMISSVVFFSDKPAPTARCNRQTDRQTDWLTELRSNVPLDTKQVILEMLFPANLLA